jgi:hypothetical protein
VALTGSISMAQQTGGGVPGGSGGGPTGAAGGALSGTYPNPGMNGCTTAPTGSGSISCPGSVSGGAIIPSKTPVIDVRSQGALCNGSNDDTAAIAAAAALAGTLGGILYIPNTGSACLTASAVSLPTNAWMEVEGDLQATAAMSAVVTVGDSTHTAMGKSIYGHGTIDPANTASRGVFVRAYQHYVVQEVTIGAGTVAGIEFGDSTLSCRADGICYEGYALHTREVLPSGTAKTTGSIGIDLIGSDGLIDGNVVIGYDIGISDSSNGSIISNNHVWGYAANAASTCYAGVLGNSRWINDIADTCTSYGFYFSSASDQVSEALVQSNSGFSSSSFIGMYFLYSTPNASVINSSFEGGGSGNLMTSAIGGFVNSGLYLAGNQCGSFVTSCDVVGSNYGVGTGSANAQTVTTLNGSGPYPNAYHLGQQYCWLPAAANTSTTPTINVNSLGALTITKFGRAALAANDLITTAIACTTYDGTYMELQNPATLQPQVYTVSTLPSASSVAAGTQVVITDATTFTVGTCTGGGSDTMIAVSNGTSWSCH